MEFIKRFKILVAGVNFKVVTDCSAVQQTFSKKDLLPSIARWWLLIQRFHFEVDHRPGHKMTHVDALSRNVAQISVLKVNLDDWLSCIQLQDERAVSLRKRLVEGTDHNLNKYYKIKQNKLYRTTADGSLKLVIPRLARFHLLRKFHDGVGHLGLKRCENLIKKQFWFEGMTGFIKKYNRSQYGKKEGYLYSQSINLWNLSTPGISII